MSQEYQGAIHRNLRPWSFRRTSCNREIPCLVELEWGDSRAGDWSEYLRDAMLSLPPIGGGDGQFAPGGEHEGYGVTGMVVFQGGYRIEREVLIPSLVRWQGAWDCGYHKGSSCWITLAPGFKGENCFRWIDRDPDPVGEYSGFRAGMKDLLIDLNGQANGPVAYLSQQSDFSDNSILGAGEGHYALEVHGDTSTLARNFIDAYGPLWGEDGVEPVRTRSGQAGVKGRAGIVAPRRLVNCHFPNTTVHRAGCAMEFHSPFQCTGNLETEICEVPIRIKYDATGNEFTGCRFLHADCLMEVEYLRWGARSTGFRLQGGPGEGKQVSRMVVRMKDEPKIPNDKSTWTEHLVPGRDFDFHLKDLLTAPPEEGLDGPGMELTPAGE